MLDQKTLVKNLMTGKDGSLFISVGDATVELFEIDTYSVKANYTNLDYQPVGSYQKFGVPADVSYTLTFTEAVVRDDIIMKPLMDAAKAGKNISFTFRAKVKRPDDTKAHLVLEECIPDGEFDLMTLTPGEIIKRNQSFRVNGAPDFQDWLKDL
ncbi:MAG: hypothetical protein HFE72_13515 [Emergencia sp.]|nr:hypothetical protein [Emergencia sp.]